MFEVQETTPATPLDVQRAAVAREIAMRRSVYPKWVAAGKMKQEKAEAELAAMNAVLATLEALACAPENNERVAAAEKRANDAWAAARMERERADAYQQELAWIPCSERLPDDDLLVMIALIDSDEPVWVGYHDGDGWFAANADPVKVSHWRPMPKGPA